MQKKGGGSTDSEKTVLKPPGGKGPIRGKTFMGLAGIAPGATVAVSSQPLVEEKIGENKDTRISKTEDHYYEPIEELGRGGMGIVYKATQVMKVKGSKRSVKRQVALKVINFDSEYVNQDPSQKEKIIWEMVERFVTEADLVAKLEHRNVIKLLDFGQTDQGELYYAMEFLEGMDLEKFIHESGGFLTWEVAKPIIEQVCSALDAAHNYKDRETREKRPIIHRDIKPANIFLTRDEEGNMLVKVLDFGLGKIHTPRGEEVTHVGEGAGGTPEYMSPEQAWCLSDVDHRTDIYAVGAMLYHMLAGREPFIFERPEQREGQTSEEYIVALNEAYNRFRNMIWETPPPLLRQVAPGRDIPEELEGIVMKCLEKDPKKRYQSMRELKEALSKCNGGKNGNAGPQVDPSQTVIVDDAKLRGGEQNGTAMPLATADKWESGAGLFTDTGTQIVRIRSTIQEGNKLHLQDTRRIPPPRKFSKWLIAGAITLASLGGIAGVVTTLERNAGKQTSSVYEPIKRPQSGTTLIRNQPAIEAPQTAGITQTAGDADAVQRQEAAEAQNDTAHADVVKERTHIITVRTGVRGVQVFLWGREACRTQDDGTCVLRVAAGTEPVQLKFRLRGYREVCRDIIPDHDQDVRVTMKRPSTKARPGEPRSGIHVILDRGDNQRRIIPPE